MNDARRERVRELVRTLESVGEQVRTILNEEASAFEGRSAASRETESGNVSEGASFHLGEATTDIQSAIEQMQYAIGDDSLPEPIPAPIRRRV